MSFNAAETRDFHGRWTRGTAGLVHEVLNSLHEGGHLSGAEHDQARKAVASFKKDLNKVVGKPPHDSLFTGEVADHARKALGAVSQFVRKDAVDAAHRGLDKAATTKRKWAAAVDKASKLVKKHGHELALRAYAKYFDAKGKRERNLRKGGVRDTNPYPRFTRSGRAVRTRPMPAAHQKVIDQLWHSAPARAAKRQKAELALAFHTLRDPNVSLKDKGKIAAGVGAAVATYFSLEHLGPIGALIAASPADDLMAGALLRKGISSATGKGETKNGGIHPHLAHALRQAQGGQHSNVTMAQLASHMTSGYHMGVTAPPRSRKFGANKVS